MIQESFWHHQSTLLDQDNYITHLFIIFFSHPILNIIWSYLFFIDFFNYISHINKKPHSTVFINNKDGMVFSNKNHNFK